MRIVLIAALLGVSLQAADERPVRINGGYLATAYSVTGITASGEWTHRHIVAADPDILPVGSRVKVTRAGKYSGEYVVADTGAKIQGHRLDIYMPGERECKKFGVKPVRVKVVELGDGTRHAVKQADKTVKADVAKDVSRGVVGNAATEVDWRTKGAPVAAAAKAAAAATSATGPQGTAKAATPPNTTKTDATKQQQQ
jgi:3D (Asp-Asp-Asp) domain-containing protein